MYTGFNPLGQSTVFRSKKDGTRVSVPCPTAIEAYKFMGGVDRGDHLRGYYHRKLKFLQVHLLLSVESISHQCIHFVPRESPSFENSHQELSGAFGIAVNRQIL